MKNIKNELQNLIFNDEPTGNSKPVKKVQIFLRRNAKSSKISSKE